MKSILIFIFCSISFFGSSQTISNTQKDSVIQKIKQLVLQNYVILDKAKLLSDSLNPANYLSLDLRDSFLNKLNADLFRLTNDKHLFLQYRPAVASDMKKGSDIHKEQDKREKKENYGFEKPLILEGNIGYLKLNYFAYAKGATKQVLKTIKPLKKTIALILDLRNNNGGNGTMIELLSGIFLPAGQTELLDISYRSGNHVTMKAQKIKSSDQYLNHPLYVLCNRETYSAAEAFAFILKNRKRAILVGETTAGAGNVAGPYPVDNQFIITIPVGQIIDPITKTGWEQTGVLPDSIANPANARDKALELIRAH